jgi:hypothetical protein
MARIVLPYCIGEARYAVSAVITRGRRIRINF